MEWIATGTKDVFGRDCVSVTAKDGKEVVERTMTVSDFLKLFGDSLEVKPTFQKIEGDWLPDKYYDLQFFDTENWGIVFPVKTAKRLLVHTSGQYEVWYPNLVFFLMVRNGAITEKNCFAVKEVVPDAELYRYPFGNVSSSGSICMGNIDIDVRKGPMAFLDEFFLGVTNNDYYSSDCAVTQKWSQSKLLENLSKESSFPAKWLKQLSTKGTVTDLCKELDRDVAK